MIQGPHTDAHIYSGMRDACRKVYAAEGVRGLYVGFGASMLTHIPASAASWAVYEYTKKLLYRHWYWPAHGVDASERGAHREGSHVVNTIAGALGGGIGGWVSTPFDVVRVRKQAEGHSHKLHGTVADAPREVTAATADSYHAQRRYRSTFQSLALIFRENGVRGLFRGATLRSMSWAPQSALGYVAYETLKNLSKKSNVQL